MEEPSLRLTRGNLEAFARYREDRLVARLSYRLEQGGYPAGVDPAPPRTVLRKHVRAALGRWRVPGEEEILSIHLLLAVAGLLQEDPLPSRVRRVLEHPASRPGGKVGKLARLLSLEPPDLPPPLPVPPPPEVLEIEEPYLAADAVPPVRRRSLDEALPHLLASPRTFVVVDGARHPAVADLAAALGPGRARPLFRDTALERSTRVAPCVFGLDDETWQVVQGRLWDAAWGLVLVAGPGEPPSLAAVSDHCSSLLFARLPTGEPFLFRFHDPAIFHVFVGSASPGQLAAVFGPFEQVATCWEATAGDLVTWHRATIAGSR